MTDEFALLLLEQHSVFTLAQANACGVTLDFVRAKIDAERWRRTSHGVVVAYNGPLTDQAKLWAAVLACGRLALISHDSAAHLHGLRPTVPTKIHVMVPHGRRIAAKAGIELHRTRRPARRAPGRRLPRTCVEDTILDQADESTRADTVIGLVVTAISKRATTTTKLAAALAERRRVRWRDLLRDLLSDSRGIESALEWRYHHGVEIAHGLPTGDRQHRVVVDGREEHRDVVYKEQRVVVELDGRLGHEGVGAFKDMRRDNAAAVRGELTLRYGWMDVAGQRCRVARQVADILTRRGWRGTFQRCPDCP
jgi:predicted transcriptional regulator of viral defense system